MPTDPTVLSARRGALALAVLLASACGTARSRGVVVEQGDACAKEFEDCAPPAPFAANADVAKLDVRKLVQASSRLDLRDLAARAAKRLRALAEVADASTLEEIEAAMEDASNLLGKCRCPEVIPEIEKRGIREVVAKRLPSPEQRSPEAWAERVVAKLAEVRAVDRRAAGILVAGDMLASQETEKRMQAAERDVCETVVAARAALPEEKLQQMIDLVAQRISSDVGAGSAERAAQRIREYAGASGCGP